MLENYTLETLTNTCCLCYEKGEIDLLEHKVKLNDPVDEEATGLNEHSCDEILAFELLKIYQDIDVYSFCMELKLLCEACLAKLKHCYTFYRNIKLALAQKQQLLMKAAQKLENENLADLIIEEIQTETSDEIIMEEHLENEQFDYVVEAMECETAATENSINELDESVSKKSDTTVEDADVVNAEAAASVEEQEYIVSFAENVDTDSSVENETISFDVHISNEAAIETETKDENKKTKPPLTEHKRTRLKTSKPKPIAKLPMQLPHEDASLVVTQFLPVKTQMRLETPSLDAESENQIATQDLSTALSTVDFAAVELKSCNFEHNESGELEFKNNFFCNDADDADNRPNSEIFVCKYCPQAFAASSYLIAHVRKSHVCKYCTQAFEKTLDLYVHIRQAHYQHKCAICQKELSSQSNLRGHIKRVHGIRLPAQVALIDYRSNSNGGIGD